MDSGQRRSGFWEKGGVNSSKTQRGVPVDLHAILSSLVHFQGRVRKFQDVLKEIQVEDINEIMEECLYQKDYHDFFNNGEKVFTLVRDNIPPPPPVYIPRWISTRVKLNPDIFQHDPTSVFVFKGIQRQQLTELARPNIISSSSSQLTQLTSRFILLETDVDWEIIRNLSSVPTYLIKFEADPPNFILEETSGAPKPLQSANEKIFISEDELLETVQKSKTSSGVCICDNSGTGKSYLLASFARKTSRRYPDSLVAYIPFSQFIANLRAPVQQTDLNPCNALTLILEHIAPTPLAKAVLVQAINKRSLQLDVFFDGFDEIPRENIKWALEVLRVVTLNKKNVTLYVTSRPKYRNELEAALGLVSYDILPFSSANQLEYLVKFWKLNSMPSHQEESILREFGTICLQQMKAPVSIGERDMIGIPLQCFLVAQGNLKNAQLYSPPPERNASTETVTLMKPSSIYEMFKCLMEERFGSLAEDARKKGNTNAKTLHLWQALTTLFPEYAEVYARHDKQFTPDNMASASLEHLQVGLLEEQCHGDSVTTRFVHETFAEFLAAQYFSDILIGAECKISNKILLESTVFLALSVRVTEMHKYSWLKNPYNFYSLSLPSCTWLCEFNYPVIAYFINSYLATEDQTHSVHQFVVDAFATCFKADAFYQILYCCIVHNYIHLFHFLMHILSEIKQAARQKYRNYLLQKAIPVEIVEGQTTGQELLERSTFLLYIAAVYSDAQMTEAVFHLFNECFSYDLSEVCRNIPVQIITPLHLAIEKVDNDLVNYYVNKMGVEERHILYYCVRNSYGESMELVRRRIDICKLLLSKSVNLVDETAFIPLVCIKYTNFELIKFLIHNGADIYASAGDATIVSVAAQYMSSSDFHELVDFLIVDCSADELFLPNYTKSLYPLHSIFKNGAHLSAATIKMILDTPGIHINEKDGQGKSLIFYALQGNQPVAILEELVRRGAPHKKKDRLSERVLHEFEGDSVSVEVIRYLRSFGLSVNVRDKEGNTAILLASQHLHIIKGLVVNENANIYAENKFGDTVAHLAAKVMSQEDFHELVSFLLTKYKAGDLFKMKNKLGRTPLQERLLVQTLDIGGETIELLLGLPGVKVNAVDKAGNNLVLLAVEGGKSVDILRSLISLGADYKKCNKKGENVLHLAVRNGYVDALRYFLSLGMKLGQSRAQSPLDRAMEELSKKHGLKLHEEIVSILKEDERKDELPERVCGIAAEEGMPLLDVHQQKPKKKSFKDRLQKWLSHVLR